MTIAAELDRIISAKNDILSAINDKGVSTAGTTSISQCPALINAIQTGGGGGSNTLINSGFTGSAVVSGSGAFRFAQTPTELFGISSISGESGFISSRNATRTAYQEATIAFDPVIQKISGFTATGIPNYTAGSAYIVISVRSSDTNIAYSSAIYSKAINSTNSALITATANANALTLINSALSSNTGRKIYLMTGISASGSQSADLRTGYTASTADISAAASIVTSTALPYPNGPQSASGCLCVTVTASETVTGEMSAMTAKIIGLLGTTTTISGSSYGGSGQLGYTLSGNDSVTYSLSSYSSLPLGFSVFNARKSASALITSTASAARVYTSLYPSAYYKYSALTDPPRTVSIVSQNII